MNARDPHAPRPKKSYAKPAMVTETLTVVAALCNGLGTGGRKSNNPPCQASKLKS